ncbi:ABC transporter permease [Aurantiacibacter xanthus]|uniref:ABC transporter permease n=1 Tax=Aurantiacibacter xanthus TaxID=1784712 RepID=UPI001749201F|nr:ABC transporter permease [Aurantiacibacter xanthus]
MTIREAFFGTLREVVRQRDVASLVVLAVLLYGIYYPAPYAHQRAREVPMAVVDLEDSALTRRLVATLDASDGAAVVAQPDSLAQGQQLLKARKVEAVLLIPRGVTRAALRGEGPRIALWIDGVYLVRAKSIGAALQSALAGIFADLSGPYLGGHGVAAPLIVTQRFNPGGGYANYIFPAVTPVILQQTLLFGTAVLLAFRRRSGRAALADARDLAGTWAALTTLSVLAALFYFGWFFAFQSLPQQADVALRVAIALAMGGATAAFALAVGSLFRRSETALLILMPTTLTAFFLSGATWPRAAMPDWVAFIGALLPATHGARALLLADQMGAPTAVVLPVLGQLLLLGAAYLIVALVIGRRA